MNTATRYLLRAATPPGQAQVQPEYSAQYRTGYVHGWYWGLVCGWVAGALLGAAATLLGLWAAGWLPRTAVVLT